MLNPLVFIETELDLENNKNIIDFPKSSPTNDMMITGNISLHHNWTRHGRSAEVAFVSEAREVYVDDNENKYMAGIFFDNLDNYVYVEKYDSLGQFQWNISWNGGLDIGFNFLSGAVNKYQEVYLTGGHIVEGGGLTSNSDVFLLKINSGGSVGWVRSWGLGGDSDFRDIGYGVACDSSGNPYVTGRMYYNFPQSSNLLLLKYNRNGNLLWERNWDYASAVDQGNSIEIDSNDNIYITGYTRDSNWNLCLLKYNNSGDFEWAQVWNPTDHSTGTSLAIDSVDNILVIGSYQRDPGNIKTASLLKFNSSGNLNWNISMLSPDDAELNNIIVDPFDNLYILGNGNFFNDSHSFYIFKFNSSGQLPNYGYSDNFFSDKMNLDCDSYGNIYLVGWYDYVNYRSFSLAKYNADCDNDGLNNQFEMDVLGTDPNDPDSDSDNLIDMEEYEGNIYWKYPAPTDPLDPDTDNDNLTDYEELLIYLIDPNDNDTDDDNLSDGEEVGIYNTDPLISDSDSDGLSDWSEVISYNTNPLSNDTDSDTMLDKWEVDNALDPLVNDTILDPDLDLLTNLEEYLLNTNPRNNDTDNDNLIDGQEIYSYGTNPLISDTDGDGLSDGREVNTHSTDPLVSDSDSDGLSDGVEVNSYNTDPLSNDTDSDTMLDKWEVDNALDPLVNDTNEDPDSDNLLNIEEYQMDCDPQDDDTDNDGWFDGDEVHIYGTDPTDPNSHPNPPSPGNIPSFSLFIIGLVSILSIFAILPKIKLKK